MNPDLHVSLPLILHQPHLQFRFNLKLPCNKSESEIIVQKYFIQLELSGCNSVGEAVVAPRSPHSIWLGGPTPGLSRVFLLQGSSTKAPTPMDNHWTSTLASFLSICILALALGASTVASRHLSFHPPC